jgi:L-threonylcarbamoyladenylate synthase
MEEKQIEVDEKTVLEWKEGEDTFVLPITTADIIKDTSMTVKFKEFSQSRSSIRLAAKLLRADCIVAFPTETVYGLGANALSTSAVEKIYKAKNRPADNPLITHFGSLRQLESFATIPLVYRPLVEKFWPGPLTILLPVTEEMGISPLVTAGLDTVAIRIPSSPLARALLLESNIPIAAPSANASTRPSPTLAQHVVTDLNRRIPLILSADEDVGSQCEVGLESTVVDALSDPPTILRLGGISPEEIRSLGGVWKNTTVYQKPASTVTTNGISEEFKPRTPGMKYRHYSPQCPVYVYPFNAPQPDRPSKHLAPSDVVDRKVAVLCTRNWEPKEDPGAALNFNWMGDGDQDIARSLFKAVRDMDEWGAEVIVVEGVEEVGLGRSIMERLRKMGGGVIGEKN